jgi:hypothetical protein
MSDDTYDSDDSYDSDSDSDDTYDSDDSDDSEEEMFAISYRAVTPGLPVVTSSGEQFATVHHVLEVPELDVFDGIVVNTGTGLAADQPKHHGLAHLEMLTLGQQRGWLRFVDADEIDIITTGYVKCTFDQSRVADLPVPDGPPVLYPDMNLEDRMSAHQMYGQWFGRGNLSGPRARWTRKKN